MKFEVKSVGDPFVLESVKATPEQILNIISVGDRVTVVDRFGKQRTGRAVMRGPYGWVLNMGGRHGTPFVAVPECIVKISKRAKSGGVK